MTRAGCFCPSMDAADTPELGVLKGALDWTQRSSPVPRIDPSIGAGCPTSRASVKLPTMAELRTQVIASTSGVALATVALNPLMIVK
eukprot:7105203-Pyramimonas_sp.AAC.1